MTILSIRLTAYCGYTARCDRSRQRDAALACWYTASHVTVYHLLHAAVWCGGKQPTARFYRETTLRSTRRERRSARHANVHKAVPCPVSVQANRRVQRCPNPPARHRPADVRTHTHVRQRICMLTATELHVSKGHISDHGAALWRVAAAACGADCEVAASSSRSEKSLPSDQAAGTALQCRVYTERLEQREPYRAYRPDRVIFLVTSTSATTVYVVPGMSSCATVTLRDVALCAPARNTGVETLSIPPRNIWADQETTRHKCKMNRHGLRRCGGGKHRG